MIIGIKRQSYYKQIKSEKLMEEKIEEIVYKTQSLRQIMPALGGRKLYSKLKEDETELMKSIGRDKYFRILAERDLLVKPKKKKHFYAKSLPQSYENLKERAVINRRNQLIESDFTYLYVNHKPAALALSMDIYSRKILGWNLSKEFSSQTAVKALRMAVGQTEKEEFLGSIHHSDQGIQYSSTQYQEELKLLGFSTSMSRRATPTDSAHIERVNNTLKNEFNLKRNFPSMDTAKDAVALSILIYNRLRPHMSLNYRTPDQVYESS